MNVFIDYAKAKECVNPETWYLCYKCGACGRRFKDGMMVDDGGTHPDVDDED